MKRLLRILLPFIYIPIGIILPIYGFDTDYGWSVVVSFWIPIFILSFVVLPGESKPMRFAFLATSLSFIPVTFAFEYIGLSLDIWNFSEKHCALWGPKIMGAPIEEFVFWFGATPLCMLIYLYYRKLIDGVSK
jgi:lycopene cyclase domain-containing protein